MKDKRIGVYADIDKEIEIKRAEIEAYKKRKDQLEDELVYLCADIKDFEKALEGLIAAFNANLSIETRAIKGEV